MSSVQLQNLSTSFSVERESEYPRVFEDIFLNVTDKRLGPVASLSAVKITREECRGCFLDTMDAHSDDLQFLSVELFDNYGRVHPWLIEPGSRSGTGCWDEKLNSGRLVFIMKMSVIEKYRGQGIGSFMLKQFVTSKLVDKNFDTVMCWPPLESREIADWKQVKEKQVAFFRKNGFRRIGRTGILGYSPIETHPSRSIPVALDANEKGQEFENIDVYLSIDEVRRKYPVHTAIINSERQELDVAGTIKNHYQLDPTSIHRPNSLGYTPIHIALMTANLEAVRVLLQMGVTEDLVNSHNVECRTPMEALESVMLSSRQKDSAPGGLWKGYNDNELTCEFLVKSVMGKPTMAETLEAYIVKRKWGCTCGACADGWLSRCMRSNLSTLVFEALEMSDMELDLNGFFLIRDFPPKLLESVTPTFYNGCRAIFEAVREFLDESDEPLSVAAIAARNLNNDAVKPFFERGGQITDVLDSITRMMKTLRSDMLPEDDWAEFMEHEGLRACANDLDFALVRQRLGLNAIVLLPEDF